MDTIPVSGSETAVTVQVEHSGQGYPEVNAECRALTVSGSTPVREARDIPYRSAAFVTQLLAAKEGLPQTRERRREAPDIAAHVYEAHMAPSSSGQGRVISRAA